MTGSPSPQLLHSTPRIAFLATEGSPVAPLAAGHAAIHFHAVEELLAAATPPDAVLINVNEAETARSWLRTLRSDVRLGRSPLFLSGCADPEALALANGTPGSGETLLHRVEEYRSRRASLNRSGPLDDDAALLTFLHLHPDYVLEPIADWHDAHVFRYPLAELLAAPPENGHTLLERLRQRGLLESLQLAERVHVCPRCESAHLLFAEQCPQCAGIDVVEQNFLHCYACGHVAGQEQYLGPQGLACPKCSVRLRHIGVDYDRALETLACKGCQGRFAEAVVKARCARCQAVSATDELAERRYYRLRLSRSGEHAARTGSIGSLFALFDELSQAHPAYFNQTLDWLLGLSRRHEEVQFGLVGLKLLNLRALAAQASRPQLARQLDALAGRLRELVRTTDIFMRDDEEVCWLLLPQTPPEGVTVLRRRIEALDAAGGAEPLRLATVAICSSDLRGSDPRGTAASAREVLARLRAQFA